MKNLLKLLPLVFVLVFASCNKEEEGPNYGEFELIGQATIDLWATSWVFFPTDDQQMTADAYKAIFEDGSVSYKLQAAFNGYDMVFDLLANGSVGYDHTQPILVMSADGGAALQIDPGTIYCIYTGEAGAKTPPTWVAVERTLTFAPVKAKKQTEISDPTAGSLALPGSNMVITLPVETD